MIRRARLGGPAILLIAGLAVPAQAEAFKPRTHLFVANEVIAPIAAGRDAVEIDGREFAVRPEVARAIRAHPQDFRGGAIGPDAFPDIPGGQGSIHSDTRTLNGAQPNRAAGRGRSFAHQWLALVYREAWRRHDGCNGCDAGQRALAFAYGFLTHAAGDVWAHTFVNDFADGVFPGVGELGQLATRRHATRHIIVEGYIDRHTPSTVQSFEAPTGFIHDTLIQTDRAAELGRGPVIEYFKGLRSRLKTRRDRNRRDLRRQNRVRVCAFGRCTRVPDVRDAPLNVVEAAALLAENAYINAWRSDIANGLEEYVDLSLDFAEALFEDDDGADLGAARDAASDWVRDHGLSMIGVPDAVGASIRRIRAFEDFLQRMLGPIPGALRNMRQRIVQALLETPLGVTLADFAEYLRNPENHINSSAQEVALPPDTSQRIDAVMGLTRSGVENPGDDYDPDVFPVVRNAITLSKLALLDGAGMNAVLAGRGAPGLYDPTRDTAPDDENVMLGWARSLDGQHQWRATSPRDGRAYGDGDMALWERCVARDPVFRTGITVRGTERGETVQVPPLFRDWENDPPFPDLGDPCS